MTSRQYISFAVCLAVFAASGLGLNNGMVLRVDHHGHVALDAPHLSHALAHADGADHDAADYDSHYHHHLSDPGTDSEHHDLHVLIATVSDSHVATAKTDGSATQNVSAEHPFCFDLYFPAMVGMAIMLPARVGLEAADHRGSTARSEVASLRAIVLLV